MSKYNLDEYLKDEYQNIAEAHFRTIEAISSFFRYYLLIMSAPIPILALYISLSGQTQGILELLQNFKLLVSILLFVISLAGFFVMLYVINLRMDAVLYARTVNSIRKRFFDSAKNVNFDTKIRMRVLPQSQTQPDYYEPGYFLPVILAFAIFNVFYLIAAVGILTFSFDKTTGSIELFTNFPWWLLTLIALIYMLVHVGVYKGYARYREHTYMRSYTLGVDIDGVINLHRDHFCELLREKTGKAQDPSLITTIPLHDCLLLDVSREEEKLVFNDPRYWIDMPVIDVVKQNFDRLRGLKVKIHVFSHRPWPDTYDASEDVRKAIHISWKEAARRLLRETSKGDPFKYLVYLIRLKIGVPEIDPWKALWFDLPKHAKFFRQRVRDMLGMRPIEIITRWWLIKNKLDYKELTIERGNENVADPQGHFRNRFYISRKKKIRYFVEDDLEKAQKLAYICDVVFLVEHPYNIGYEKICESCKHDCKREKVDLSSTNIRQVKSWDEIYRSIRLLS